MQKKVLYAVLDWGLGHATRSIPIIKKLAEQGYSVTIAGSGDSLELLKNYFPQNKFIELSAIKISYSKNWVYFNWWKISLQMAWLYFSDQKFVKNTTEKFDFIVSDNRYGFFSKKRKSIFITHQCSIIPPKGFNLFSKIINLLNKKTLKKFNEIWIPDFYSKMSLSGKLSEKCAHKNSKNINIASRFKGITPKKEKKYQKYQVLIILSGPEPQRTQFEKNIIEKLNNLKIKSLLIAGRPKIKLNIKSDFIDYSWHLNDQNFANAIISIPYIIARAGYSTIMDLVILKKTALLIPSPKQSEQEYLAYYLEKKRLFKRCKQSEINKWNHLPMLFKNVDFPENQTLNITLE